VTRVGLEEENRSGTTSKVDDAVTQSADEPDYYELEVSGELEDSRCLHTIAATEQFKTGLPYTAENGHKLLIYRVPQSKQYRCGFALLLLQDKSFVISFLC
jgi:hypothetical protein